MDTAISTLLNFRLLRPLESKFLLQGQLSGSACRRLGCQFPLSSGLHEKSQPSPSNRRTGCLSLARKSMLFCSLNNNMTQAPSFEAKERFALMRRDDEAADLLGSKEKGVASNASFEEVRAKRFNNRFLNFTRLGSIIDDATESFFKSEIRRRLFVTAVLIIVSRLGYFIPLPGFDRRLIPDTYLSFAAGSTDVI